MRLSTVAIVVGMMVTAVAPLTPRAEAAVLCQDVHQERAGALKWAAQGVVFSASTAIATRTVDMEWRGDDCVLVSVRCFAAAADGSTLEVRIGGSGSTYSARFKAAPTISHVGGTCDDVRAFGAATLALRTLFEG